MSLEFGGVHAEPRHPHKVQHQVPNSHFCLRVGGQPSFELSQAAGWLHQAVFSSFSSLIEQTYSDGLTDRMIVRTCLSCRVWGMYSKERKKEMKRKKGRKKEKHIWDNCVHDLLFGTARSTPKMRSSMVTDQHVQCCFGICA